MIDMEKQKKYYGEKYYKCGYEKCEYKCKDKKDLMKHLREEHC